MRPARSAAKINHAFRLQTSAWWVISRVRKPVIISLLIGVTLGCVAGAMIETRQTSTVTAKPYIVSVNQSTGKPQLHVQGKAEPQ
ncbi:MAG: hypothetical protein ACR2MW_10065 [Chthoniobacterales bacterium]